MTRLFAGTPFDRPPRCTRCGELERDCHCPPPPIPPQEQTARLRVEKRKQGKVATVIEGLPAVGNDLPELLRTLKNACGAGGSLQGEMLEVQGNHLTRISEVLSQLGYRIKR